MAEEKSKVVADAEYKEVGSENQQNEAPKADKPAEEKNAKKLTVPKWLKTTGRVIEGVAATFGTIVGGVLIYDRVRRPKKPSAPPVVYQDRPTYIPPQQTTFDAEFHNDGSGIE